MSAHILSYRLSARLFGAVLLAVPTLVGPASAAEEMIPLKTVQWSFEGPLGTFDRPSLQRGFQVFKEVCASCHTLEYVPFRDLGEPGGPGFSKAEVKAIAAAYEKDIIDDTGDTKQVPRTPSDTFPAPFANEQAARAANGGALPPDLSLITHARKGGPNYVYSLLTGFRDPPEGFQMREGMNYNEVFPTHQIAMPPPLTDDRVTYADGTPASVDQMAKDVVTFLEWTADPKLEARKRLGLSVLGYLAIVTVLLYMSYRKIWRDQH